MGVAFRNSTGVWPVSPIEFEADSSQFPTAAPADRPSPFRDGGDCDADLKRPLQWHHFRRENLTVSQPNEGIVESGTIVAKIARRIGVSEQTFDLLAQAHLADPDGSSCNATWPRSDQPPRCACGSRTAGLRSRYLKPLVAHGIGCGMSFDFH